MAFLDISHLEKSFAANRVVTDFNLEIAQGEFVSLLGPSGCGKTTVLRMVAGFETPSSGAIRIEGHDIVAQRPNQRNIGMVFQAYALFPNLTVAQNVGFGLKVAGVARAEAKSRVQEMLDLIGLPDLGGRYPFQLSGGQQQRVALARALAVRPRVLLLDEPLSALDAKIRVSLRNEIREIQQRLGITTIFVTHDQEEALSMSDRVVVMNGGIADQIGTPFEIYNRPATRFVASFVGTLNLLQADVTDAVSGQILLEGQTLKLNAAMPKIGAATLALRPEVIALKPGQGHDVSLPGTITDVHFMGSVIRVRIRTGKNHISLDTFNDAASPPPAPGQQATVSFARDALLVLND